MANNMNINIGVRDEASSKIMKIASSLGDITKLSAGFALASAGVYGLADSFSRLSSSVVDYNKKLEQSKIAYETMFGSASAANQYIKQLQEFAERTPFSFEGVNDAAMKLTGFGFAAKEVVPTLEAIGNALSGLGKNDKGVFDRVVLAIGQIKTKGKASAEELRQLAEAGIPAYAMLAEQLGLTGEQIANIGEQGIASDQAIKALLDGINKRFPDMMMKQEDTWTGIMNAIQEKSVRMGAQITEGLFGGIKSAAGQVKFWLDEVSKAFDAGGLANALEIAFGANAADIIWRLKNAFGSVIDSAVQLGKIAYDVLKPALSVVFEVATKMAEGFAIVLDKIADLITEHATAAKAVVYGLAAGFAALEAATLLSASAAVIAKAETIALTAAYVAEAIAIGEVGLALTLLGGPAAWAALAVATVTGAVIYFASDANVQNSYNAAENYAGAFYQVGNSAEEAATKVEKLTRAQLAHLQLQSGVRGEYEDMASRKGAAEKDRANYSIFNHKGTALEWTPTPSKSAANAAEKAFEEKQRLLDKIADMNAKMSEKIAEENSTTYQFGAGKLKDEIDNMKRELEKRKLDLAEYGIDTSGVEAKMQEYENLMTAKLAKTQQRAADELVQNTAKMNAQITGDTAKAAEAEYQIRLQQIAKEKEELWKATGDKQKVLDWEVAAVRDAEAKKKLAIGEAKWNTKNNSWTQKLFDFGGRFLSDKQNELRDLDRSMDEIQTKYSEFGPLFDKAADGSISIQADTFAKLSGITDAAKQEILDFIEWRNQRYKDINNKDGMSSFKEGIQSAAKDFGDWSSNLVELGKSTAMAMQSSFESFFFDAMTGKLKSFGDYINGFFQSIGQAISKMMANMMAQRVLNFIFPNLSFKADGGPMTAGQPYIVGERGPEFFVPPTNGTMIPAGKTASMMNGGEPKITVIVNNHTGQQADVNTGNVRWDDQLKQYIIDVTLEAAATKPWYQQAMAGR